MVNTCQTLSGETLNVSSSLPRPLPSAVRHRNGLFFFFLLCFPKTLVPLSLFSLRSISLDSILLRLICFSFTTGSENSRLNTRKIQKVYPTKIIHSHFLSGVFVKKKIIIITKSNRPFSSGSTYTVSLCSSRSNSFHCI